MAADGWRVAEITRYLNESLRAAQMQNLTEKYPAWQHAAKKKRMLVLEILVAQGSVSSVTFMDGIRLKAGEADNA